MYEQTKYLFAPENVTSVLWLLHTNSIHTIFFLLLLLSLPFKSIATNTINLDRKKKNEFVAIAWTFWFFVAFFSVCSLFIERSNCIFNEIFLFYFFFFAAHIENNAHTHLVDSSLTECAIRIFDEYRENAVYQTNPHLSKRQPKLNECRRGNKFDEDSRAVHSTHIWFHRWNRCLFEYCLNIHHTIGIDLFVFQFEFFHFIRYASTWPWT